MLMKKTYKSTDEHL